MNLKGRTTGVEATALKLEGQVIDVQSNVGIMSTKQQATDARLDGFDTSIQTTANNLCGLDMVLENSFVHLTSRIWLSEGHVMRWASSVFKDVHEKAYLIQKRREPIATRLQQLTELFAQPESSRLAQSATFSEASERNVFRWVRLQLNLESSQLTVTASSWDLALVQEYFAPAQQAHVIAGQPVQKHVASHQPVQDYGASQQVMGKAQVVNVQQIDQSLRNGDMRPDCCV
jgi:hypothetical protein